MASHVGDPLAAFEVEKIPRHGADCTIGGSQTGGARLPRVTRQNAAAIKKDPSPGEVWGQGPRASITRREAWLLTRVLLTMGTWRQCECARHRVR